MLANLALDGTVFTPPIWDVSTAEYPFEELKSDDAWNGIGSSVLWGFDGGAVVASNEGHGVIAGSASFVETMCCNLPSHGGGLAEIIDGLYIREAEQHEANERLRLMIGRLYGDAVAASVLAELPGEGG